MRSVEIHLRDALERLPHKIVEEGQFGLGTWYRTVRLEISACLIVYGVEEPIRYMQAFIRNSVM